MHSSQLMEPYRQRVLKTDLLSNRSTSSTPSMKWQLHTTAAPTCSKIPLPSHLSISSSSSNRNNFVCLNVDCTDTFCATETWETDVRNSLLRRVEAQQQQSQQPLAKPLFTEHCPLPNVEQQPTSTTAKHQPISLSSSRNISSTMPNNKETPPGRTCGACGKPTIALYPQNKRAMVCRTCFLRSRK